jgi:hypothetical protein
MSESEDYRTKVDQVRAEFQSLDRWRKQSPRRFCLTVVSGLAALGLYYWLYLRPLRTDVQGLLDRQQDVELRYQDLQSRLESVEGKLSARNSAILHRTIGEKAMRRATNRLASIPPLPVSIWPLDTSSEGRRYCEQVQHAFHSAGWTNTTIVAGVGESFKGVLIAGYDRLPGDLKAALDELFRDEYSDASEIGAFSRKNRNETQSKEASSLVIFVGAQ